MLLMGGTANKALEPDYINNRQRQPIDIDLKKYIMTKVDVTIRRDKSSGRINSVIKLHDGLVIHIKGDAGKSKEVVVRPIGYKI